MSTPKVVLDFFEARSAMYISRELYKPRNFNRLLWISHEDGSRTFVAEQNKTYESTTGHTEEIVHFFVRMNDASGSKIGHAEIRRDISAKNAIFDGRPFIGFINTESEYRRRGHGTHLLRLMALYSRLRFEKTLYSATLISETLKPLLEKLCKCGLARPNQYRYGENKFHPAYDIL